MFSNGRTATRPTSAFPAPPGRNRRARNTPAEARTTSAASAAKARFLAGGFGAARCAPLAAVVEAAEVGRGGGAGRGRRARCLRESERDVSRRLEPFLAILLQAVPDDAIEREGEVPPRLGERRRFLPEDRRHRVARRLLPERPLAREQLVEDRPEREDVRAVIHGKPAHLLGRHVPDRPHHGPGLRVPGHGRSARLFARRRRRRVSWPGRSRGS